MAQSIRIEQEYREPPRAFGIFRFSAHARLLTNRIARAAPVHVLYHGQAPPAPAYPTKNATKQRRKNEKKKSKKKEHTKSVALFICERVQYSFVI